MARKTTLNDLRDHLFDVIERLKDSNDPDVDDKEKISIESAQAIVGCSQAIINSAKLEVDFLKIVAENGGANTFQAAVSKSSMFMLDESSNR